MTNLVTGIYAAYAGHSPVIAMSGGFSSGEANAALLPIVTTEAGKGEVVEALRNGVNNYIVKPFTPAILKEKLSAVIEV